MAKKTAFTREYLDNWPRFYYQTNDMALRKTCLEEYLREHPDSRDDLRRMEVYKRRYTEGFRKRDNYFMAFTLLKAESESSRLFNQKQRESNIRTCLIDLDILSDKEPDEIQIAEWRHFAREWMKNAWEGTAYSSNLMGLMKVSERDKAMRIANDIRTITYVLPREVLLEKQASVLRSLLEDAFREYAEDADDILKTTR